MSDRRLLSWQVEGNLDTSSGWGEVFRTAISDPTLVVRSGKLSPGRSYTFSLTATDTSSNSGYAGKLSMLSSTIVTAYGTLDTATVVPML